MVKKKASLIFLWIFLFLAPAGKANKEQTQKEAQPPPAWWQVILSLETKGDYQMEGRDQTFTGNYSFALRWRGLLERDNDDYLLYSLDTDVRDWTATEIVQAGESITRLTTTDFRQRPSFSLNYFIRKDQDLHLDFIVNGILVPQTESEERFLLIFPSSAENNQHLGKVHYNLHVTRGSNKVKVSEKEIYTARVEQTYSWSWKHRSWTLKPNQTITATQAHTVVVRLEVIPRFPRSSEPIKLSGGTCRKPGAVFAD